jgi:hypothetical protein
VEVERLPNGKDDIGPQLKGSWLVACDNVSIITPTVSDLMSETSTGYGNSKEKLYTDEDTQRRFYRRPQGVLGNQRGDHPGRSGLAGDDRHRAQGRALPPRAEVNAEFEEARPRIFGALLDAVVSALRHHDEEPPEMSRMADFTTFIWRARYALG